MQENRLIFYIVKPVLSHMWFIHSAVKPVYKGHSTEPENVAFMGS